MQTVSLPLWQVSRLRDRLLTSATFQRWAVRLPFTRWIARRRARALFDLVAGFVYSQVLQACVRLRLLELLQSGPQSVAEIAARIAMPEEAALRLLRAAAALQLVEPRAAGRFGLGPLGAAMQANPGIAAMVEHHALLYADLADPVALLRGDVAAGSLAAFWPYAGSQAPGGLGAGEVQPYTGLMAASQGLVVDEILAAVRFDRYRHLLDVGGGNGTFASAVAAAAPAARVTVFDLPAVAELARLRFDAAALGTRVAAVGGDFFTDPWPQGADAISLVRVLHDHDDSAVASLLRSAHRSLPPAGTVLIAEPMAGGPRAERVGDAYFGLYLRAMGRGRARSPAQFAQLLHGAGFEKIQRLPTRIPLLTQVLQAQRSA
jgi:demethylspheroidene O-methyltransferase